MVLCHRAEKQADKGTREGQTPNYQPGGRDEMGICWLDASHHPASQQSRARNLGNTEPYEDLVQRGVRSEMCLRELYLLQYSTAFVILSSGPPHGPQMTPYLEYAYWVPACLGSANQPQHCRVSLLSLPGHGEITSTIAINSQDFSRSCHAAWPET